MNSRKLLSRASNFVAGIGIGCLIVPFFEPTNYRNLLFGTGLLLLLVTWVLANLEKGKLQKSSSDWNQQKKVLIGMVLCSVMGFSLLIYYEIQMPKYEVAVVTEELYRVPPQLSRKQLLSLGAECNTYGNTLCSQAVFAKIVKLDPRDFKSLANLAMAQSHLGNHNQAIANAKTALKNGFESYDLYKFYGHSLWALGNKEDAKIAYKESLRLKVNQPLLLERIGN